MSDASGRSCLIGSTPDPGLLEGQEQLVGGVPAPPPEVGQLPVPQEAMRQRVGGPQQRNIVVTPGEDAVVSLVPGERDGQRGVAPDVVGGDGPVGTVVHAVI